MKLAQVERWWSHLEDALTVACAGALVLLACVQIVLRMGFDGGLPWAEGVLRTLVLWVAMFGAVVATRQSRHVAIDALALRLPSGLQRAVHVLASLLAAATCLALAWYALSLLDMEWATPGTASEPIAPGYTWVVVPLALSMMALRYLQWALRKPGGGHA